ncbi:MFS transporter [Epidermidibacterium keratini]|uniref:MFS transporter n=1 Tax=Epidermidibacterium keratini TaxID=1891644 RepID=A0A7L4YL01_9ACTN|nr:MFS transporter [Epidermidibacterium keratini]QHB99920.1 MFS transporter [Epidermidibacterium keratini]
MAGTLTGRLRSPLLAAAADAIAISAISVIPLNLVAALSIQIALDLHFSVGALGAASAAFFGSQAAFSPFVGRIVDRLGSVRSMRLTAVLVALNLGVSAAATRSLATLMVTLVVAGAINALAQPATNQFVAERIPFRRQGSAYGAKQSAIPVASLAAGLAVPALGLTIGWRWTFTAFALTAALLAIRRPGGRQRRSSPPQPSPRALVMLRRGSLVLLSISSGLAAACGSSLSVFLVQGAVATGWSEAAAGLLLATASLFGVVGRFAAGVRADHRDGRHLVVVAAMMICGATGAALMAVGQPVVFVIGAIVSYGVGWGWPGLFIFAVVRLNSARPAAATAFVQGGTAIGAVSGPVAFGLWVGEQSFASAWAAVAVLLVIAGLVGIAARRRIVREDPFGVNAAVGGAGT